MSPRGIVLISLLALLGCEGGPTEIVVLVDSDLSIPGELTQVRIEVDSREIGGSLIERTAEVRGVDELPVSMGLQHSGGALGPIHVVAVARRMMMDDVRREARLSFIAGRTVVLELDLDRACRGVDCGADETCAEGGCRPILVRPEELLPWQADAGGRCGAEICNGEDDDCDGTTDEDFILASDARHCGECGNACPSVAPNAVAGACVAASCELTCDSGFGDCDGDATNGCEDDLRSPDHCGACGATCERFGAITSCSPTRSCVLDNCEPGFSDCDGALDTGCESDLRDRANCGGCGILCELFGATESCGMGRCELVSCDPGFDNCDGRQENGCEVDSSSDVFHCGGCGRACAESAPNSADICTDGACGISCYPGWADCDGVASTGCESNLGDPDHCGDCTTRCSGVAFLCSGDATTGYACIPPPCTSPPTRCGPTCVDTDVNPLHCGGCDVVCPTRPNSAPICAGGGCGLACDPGWGDCDGAPGNGCEAPLNTIADCGSCGADCVLTGTLTECVAGMCTVNGCAPGFADCDGSLTNGCEVSTTTLSDCGACGAACSRAGGSATCATGSCQIDVCDLGLGDCDGMDNNGCETPLGTVTDCGACGASCTGGRVCTGGVCSGGTGIVQLASGYKHHCGVHATGRVYCWGDNMFGQLGDGSTIDSSRPVMVVGITDAVAVSAGQTHSCVVHAGGTVSCWGSNARAQLGTGSFVDSPRPVPTSGITNAVEIASGDLHTCVVRMSGVVSCWGPNSRGALGDGTTMLRASPVDVVGLSDATHVTAGEAHTCARRMSGVVVCWGDGRNGALGDGGGTQRLTPVAVVGLTDAIDVSAGDRFSCAVRTMGAAVCWGRNVEGQLGDGTTNHRLTLVSVMGVSDASHVAAGTAHSCAVRGGGQVWCWGDNGRGQLGDGTTTPRLTPVRTTGLIGAMGVSGGEQASCALLSGGAVSCWGRNSDGELGDGTTTDSSVPVMVVGLP